MNDTKTKENKIYIDQKSVYIKSNINYQVIEIKCFDDFEITSLLPENYLVQKVNKKILIVKLSKDDIIKEELFTYRGNAKISSCILVDGQLNKHSFQVQRILETWNGLQGNYGEKVDWVYLTRFWEDISFDGKNNKVDTWYTRSIKDEQTKQITNIRELRKK